jgi:alcohol dehydrogenase class IV
MMPPVMKFNLEYAKEGYADIAAALGVDTPGMSLDEAANAAIAAVSQLSQDVGISQSLSELGLQRDSLPRMAKNAMLDHCYKSNPRPCTEEDMLRLYEEAF